MTFVPTLNFNGKCREAIVFCIAFVRTTAYNSFRGVYGSKNSKSLCKNRTRN